MSNSVTHKKVKGKSPKNQAGLAPYVFIAPTVLLFLMFTGYPVVYSLFLSFTTNEAGINTFAGFENYIRLFQDSLFYESLLNTFIILIFQVPIMIMFAVVLANVLHSGIHRLKGVLRVAFFTPTVTSLVAAAIIFLLILNQDFGIINYMLSSVGIDRIPWLNDPFWAKVSLIMVTIWRWTGYNMIIILAGLQVIPKDLYEAASIDGASPIRKFFSITLPQLKPVLLFAVVMSTIGTFQLFDEAFNLTGGGPINATTTVTMYLYENGFEYFDFGYASAIAYIVVLIIALLSFIQFKLAGDDD
ncbi:carbohydrate ABC transporter permease [Alkalicoccobacillus plakortidis]|uniref:Sugar ABC transporter permease n=1 Tax=Alkalicoccobacillus plakortidis TaxID=444060 RepID=A0ABT0XGZ1_9BACI|nr:sugar ABC transporter permease [Alkalicoccobacillus plakortidis]MCM2674472.1 sugar ABC transporter permease [Alkalicoccobacillus plakortidis]